MRRYKNDFQKHYTYQDVICDKNVHYVCMSCVVITGYLSPKEGFMLTIILYQNVSNGELFFQKGLFPKNLLKLPVG